MYVRENELHQWSMDQRRLTQAIAVELVYRLVRASCGDARACEFPLDDSIATPGPDGYLDAVARHDQYVPENASYWEIGTSADARKKAEDDYTKITGEIDEALRRNATLVLVTTLSKLHAWPPGNRKQHAIPKWVSAKKELDDWGDVKVLTATELQDWLRRMPAVTSWLRSAMGSPNGSVDALDVHWNAISQSDPDGHRLPADAFLENRKSEAALVLDVLNDRAPVIQFDTHYPDDVADFVSAVVASMPETEAERHVGRCIIARTQEGWNYASGLPDRHVIVAGHQIDFDGADASRLITEARSNGHSLIIHRTPGGEQHRNRVNLGAPGVPGIAKALETNGWATPKARMVAERSGGQLSTLKRIVSGLDGTPDWVKGDLRDVAVVAALLGRWDFRSEGDRKVWSSMLGQPYEQCEQQVVALAAAKETPLSGYERRWKVNSRFLTWQRIAPLVSDSKLDEVRSVAVEVLGETDPALELDKEERYAAAALGKTRTHSTSLRAGLASTLALLSVHGPAATSASAGYPEGIATRVVADLLEQPSYIVWASLDNNLPSLAEAAPEVFLDCIDELLAAPDQVLQLFNQEGGFMGGGTYTSGLLWALESLAWSPDWLPAVADALAELANLDPGGNYSNRPDNSLATILLPWLPQTTASAEERHEVIRRIAKTHPSIGWNLIMKLLPGSQSVSSGTYAPRWRQILPDNWQRGVSQDEYRDAVLDLAEIACVWAEAEPPRLLQLIDAVEDLPKATRARVRTQVAKTAPEAESELRYALWDRVRRHILRHTRHANAAWAMEEEEVNSWRQVEQAIQPEDPRAEPRWWFSTPDHDLYHEKGDYAAQAKRLNEKRARFLKEIEKRDGLDAVFSFVKLLADPERAGHIAGAHQPSLELRQTIPTCMKKSSSDPLRLFAQGMVKALGYSEGWESIEQLGVQKWVSSELLDLFLAAPFTTDTWERVEAWLPEATLDYWRQVNIGHWDVPEGWLRKLAELLVAANRPGAAIELLELSRHKHIDGYAQVAVQALKAWTGDDAGGARVSLHYVHGLLQRIQDELGSSDAIEEIEWKLMPVLGHVHEARPQALENRLAQDPDFFVEVLKLAFHRRGGAHSVEDSTPQSKSSEEGRVAEDLAARAYRLLDNWSVVPGTLPNGDIDFNRLQAWIAIALKEAAANDRAAVAQIAIGQIMVHAQSEDPIGVPDQVAEILDDRAHKDMRRGFQTALFNSRGTYGFSAGAAERSIAEGYQKRAKAAATRGFTRLARTFNELAEDYGRQARRDSREDIMERFS